MTSYVAEPSAGVAERGAAWPFATRAQQATIGDGVFSDAGVGANSHQCDGRRRPVIWGAAEILGRPHVGNNLYLLQKL